MNKVIVIGCYVPGVAVVRALADKGVEIVAMTYSNNDIAQVSKYVSEIVHVPHPNKEPRKFIDFLIDNADKWSGALILETADHTAVCISKNKAKLEEHYKIVTPDWEVLSQFIEKEKTYALAQECDVPCPKNFTPQSLSDLESVLDEISYPCLLKPVLSHEFQSKFNAKNFVVTEETELIEKYRLCYEAAQPVIVQEIIPGPDSNLYKLQGLILEDKKISSKFFHKKLRQNPPKFGVMRVGISTDKNEEVQKLTERLLFQVDFRGYFSIEFKKDPRDELLKLTEVNCRMVRCGWLSIASGVNYPWLLYMDKVNNQQIDVADYQRDFYWIELYPDLKNSISNHWEEDISLGEYIQPYLTRKKSFAVWDIHDMKPFIKLTQEKVGNAWRKVIN